MEDKRGISSKGLGKQDLEGLATSENQLNQISSQEDSNLKQYIQQETFEMILEELTEIKKILKKIYQ